MLVFQRTQVDADGHLVNLIADKHDRRVIAEGTYMLQPVFGVLIGVIDYPRIKHDYIETTSPQKELMRGMRHHLTAEVPEVHGEVAIIERGDAGEHSSALVNAIAGACRGFLHSAA